MGSQQKLSSFKHLNNDKKSKIANILDLEKKYSEKLWALFTSPNFISDLQTIESEIQKQYNELSTIWNVKNKLKIPAERIVRQYVYKNMANEIKSIYPSPISADVAFITDDAVINIDVKTIDKVGNPEDIKNLQFENNQSSFVNHNLDEDPQIPNSGTKVECYLPKEYSYNNSKPLPMLTFFFTIVYQDNKNSFYLLRNDSKYATLYLKSLPNGYLSELFNNDIVDNFKTYSYLSENPGFAPRKLNTNDPKKADDTILKIIKNDSTFIKIKGKSKIGAFNSTQINPVTKQKGVSWFPVKRKNIGFQLEAVSCGNTIRVKNETLEKRYDSNDVEWEGIKKYILK